jgi:hypothetical protein
MYVVVVGAVMYSTDLYPILLVLVNQREITRFSDMHI